MRDDLLHPAGRFALAAALAMATNYACAVTANDSGRLFYSPAERAQLEQARTRPAATRAPGVGTSPPATLRYDGMVIRSDGRGTHWVDGRAQADRAEAGGLKPGQTRADGKVFEPYQILRPAPASAVTPAPAAKEPTP